MATNDSNKTRSAYLRFGSFAGTHPDFKHDVPDSFKKAPDLKRDFNMARDPLIRIQMEELEKSEAQRRESGGVEGIKPTAKKKKKPQAEYNFPRPSMPGSKSFQHTWLQEQRIARMNGFQQQRSEKPHNPKINPTHSQEHRR